MTQAEILAKRDELEKQYGKTGHATFVTIGFDAAVELFLKREKILRDALKIGFISEENKNRMHQLSHIQLENILLHCNQVSQDALAEVPEWKPINTDKIAGE